MQMAWLTKKDRRLAVIWANSFRESRKEFKKRKPSRLLSKKWQLLKKNRLHLRKRRKYKRLLKILRQHNVKCRELRKNDCVRRRKPGALSRHCSKPRKQTQTKSSLRQGEEYIWREWRKKLVKTLKR